MSKIIKLSDDRLVTVVSAECSETSVTQDDAEMDIRAKEAVRSDVNRAKICKKPIARYDRVKKQAYIETANGEKNYAR